MAPGVGLRRRLGTGATLLLRELSAFGVVGAACFVLDLTLFQILYSTVGLGAVTSKLLASAVSTSVAFVGHRYWSFSRRARSGLRREYALFFAVNGLALALGMLMIAAVRYGLDQESALVLQLTNVASIAVGTTLRFVLYRRWVFLAPVAPDEDGPRTTTTVAAPPRPEPARP
ncbi:GtrA family protein [Blastococcus deserti]|uniref:GtrA family protein n=1 Tax=Blastococcus deserti TaxID=2259033 RepID=A0ABW4X5I4_9ACTN